MPLLVREWVENSLLEAHPVIADVLVIPALAAGLGLVMVAFTGAGRVRDCCTFASIERQRVLIVRATGDEASAALATISLFDWLVTTVWTLPADIVGHVVRILNRSVEWIAAREQFLETVAVSTLLCACAGIFLHFARLESLANIALIIPTVFALCALAYLALLYLRSQVFTMSLVLGGILMVPVCLAMATIAIPFGLPVTFAAALVQMTAESTPPGRWEIYHLQTPSSGGRGLAHSATYQLPEAIELVVNWLRQRSR